MADEFIQIGGEEKIPAEVVKAKVTALLDILKALDGGEMEISTLVAVTVVKQLMEKKLGQEVAVIFTDGKGSVFVPPTSTAIQ